MMAQLAVGEFVVAVLSIASIGVGLYQLAPWSAWVGVGVIVLGLTVIGRLRGA